MDFFCRTLVITLRNGSFHRSMVSNLSKRANFATHPKEPQIFSNIENISDSNETPVNKQIIGKKFKKARPFDKVLQHSFFDYLRECKNFETCNTQISVAHVEEILNKPIHQLTNEELISYVYLTTVKGKFPDSLRCRLDQECVSRLDSLETTQLLRLIDAWLYVRPHILNKLDFFLKSESKFKQIILDKSTNFSQFIQAYFYASLLKNKNVAKDIIKAGLGELQSNPSFLNSLSIKELSLISVSTFRTSNKITSNIFLRYISCTLKTNLPDIIHNEGIFVSLIKPLRPAEYCDLDLLNTVAKNLHLLENANIVTKIHTVALFAESLFGDFDSIKCFINLTAHDLVDIVKKKSQIIRVKDFSRFLWCISYLGFKPAVPDFEKCISDQISDWMDGNYFNNNMFSLNSMICSMYVLQFQNEEIFFKVFERFTVEELKGPNIIKNTMLLNLILSGLSIEFPHLVNEEKLKHLDPTPNPTAKKHLLTRPILKNALNTVWLLKEKMNLSDINCNFNIPYLYILGISFLTSKRRVLHVEVLDSTNCLLKSNVPHGLMKLKLRLLKKNQSNIFIIDSLTVSQRDNNFFNLIGNKIEEIDKSS